MNRIARDHEPTDADLVRRAHVGDSSAFTGLVARYQDRVYNTCYRMCGNEADALDLSQSTFLKALEALPRFQGRSSFYTWLFRIAVNLTLTHRRTQRRRPTHPLGQALDDAAPVNAVSGDRDTVSGPLERRESQERVERALGQLGDEYRVAVILRDVEGLDYSEIAEILDVPAGTVKSRISRGRAMLRDALREVRTAVE